MSISYPKAYNIDKNIIDVEDVTELTRYQKYYCISCGSELTPKIKGDFKAKHFAHKIENNDNNLNCSQETYLHNLAKQIFYKEYQKCLDKKEPFWLQYSRTLTCPKKDKDFILCSKKNQKIYEKIDLTKTFVKIKLEEFYTTFKPDVLLSNFDETDVVFIEIAVTHHVSEEKINAGHKVIEIKFWGEDFSQIYKHLINEQNHIKLINWEIDKDLSCPDAQECVKEVISYIKNSFDFLEERAIN